jgi:hypothetical protein
MAITCAETSRNVTRARAVYAVARDNDRGVYCVLSKRALALIEEKDKTDTRRTFQTGGVNFYMARQARFEGEGEDTLLVYDEEKDFLFSINEETLRSKLKRAAKNFPVSPGPKK